jgi:hypothetical protein
MAGNDRKLLVYLVVRSIETRPDKGTVPRMLQRPFIEEISKKTVEEAGVLCRVTFI